MYQQKTGYAPNEPLAAHARRRYRLTSKFPNSTGARPDPCLWIIHYTRSDPGDQVPSGAIPIDMRIQQMMSTRQYLHSQGQIIQKDFMLHDRSNWPSIRFPTGPPRGGPMYGATAPQTRVPQTMAYPVQQHPTAGPPAKRVRTQQNAGQGPAGNAAVLDADDEEDTSRGDIFDLITPKEISTSRYKQNHEWMEEILSSPYPINKIIPSDLGLGLRGELGNLTEGIFDAPHNPIEITDDLKPYPIEQDIVKFDYVGQLDPGKADEFRKRTNERIAETNKEIEKMKAKHAKRLAKFQKGSLLSLCEKELRTAVDNPSETGPEYWRLEGKIDEEEDEEGKVISKVPAKVSDIVAKVEASIGRHAAAVKELIRIRDGGYEEIVAIPSPPPPAVPTPQVTPPGSHNGSNHSGILVSDADMNTDNSVAGLLDQYHTGFSSNATPGSSFATPQPLLQALSSAGTPSNMQVPSPQPAPQNPPQQHSDVNMADAGDNNEQATSGDGTGSGDWVVVPEGGVSPTPQAQPSTTSAPEEAAHDLPTTSAPASNPSPFPATTAGTSSANTPGMPDYHASPNDFADLGDLDTAGEALASYDDDMGGGDGDMGDLGLDMDAEMGMDESAFGDAFHGVESRGEEGGEGTPGDGL